MTRYVHHERLGFLDVRQLLRVAERLRHVVDLLRVWALRGVLWAGPLRLVKLERLNELLVGLRSLLSLDDRAVGALDEVVWLHAVQLLLRALELELSLCVHEKALRVGGRSNELRLRHLHRLLRRGGLLRLLLHLLGGD